MRKRGIYYYTSIVTRFYIRGFPGLFLQWLGCRGARFEVIRGFRVIDFCSETHTRFHDVVGAALGLVAQFDPVRFRRVENAIRTIVSAPGTVGTNYQWPLRLSAVNLRTIYESTEPNHELAVKLLGSMLIRDATCGYLLDYGVPLVRRNRRRFELLCCSEAQRFMRGLGMTKTPWDRLWTVTTSETVEFAAFELFTRLLRSRQGEQESIQSEPGSDSTLHRRKRDR